MDNVTTLTLVLRAHRDRFPDPNWRLYHCQNSPSRNHLREVAYQKWLASRGITAQLENLPDWDSPEHLFFYKLLGPKTIPKANSKVGLTLIPALLFVRQGQVFITKEDAYIKLTIRPNLVKSVASLDGSAWHSIIATVVSRPGQQIELHGPFTKHVRYVPDVGDRLRFVYNSQGGFGAIQSHSQGCFGKTVKSFTAPYYHFDNCIACQDETHQIGYLIANGPRFAIIDHLQQHPEEISGQILDYYIDKVVCAKDDTQLINVTQQSFSLKVELLTINAERKELPNYCMVVGRVRGCSPVDLYSDEPEFIAKNANESDQSLFSPGTYLYIDHYFVPEHHTDSIVSPYSDASELAQICYIIGPQTPEFGSFPIRPFS